MLIHRGGQRASAIKRNAATVSLSLFVTVSTPSAWHLTNWIYLDCERGKQADREHTDTPSFALPTERGKGELSHDYDYDSLGRA